MLVNKFLSSDVFQFGVAAVIAVMLSVYVKFASRPHSAAAPRREDLAPDLLDQPRLIYGADGVISDATGRVIGAVHKDHEPALKRVVSSFRGRTAMVICDASRRHVLKVRCHVETDQCGTPTRVRALVLDVQGRLQGLIDQARWSGKHYSVTDTLGGQDGKWALKRYVSTRLFTQPGERVTVRDMTDPVAEIRRADDHSGAFVVLDAWARQVGRVDVMPDRRVALSLDVEVARWVRLLLIAAVPTLARRYPALAPRYRYKEWPPGRPENWEPPLFERPDPIIQP